MFKLLALVSVFALSRADVSLLRNPQTPPGFVQPTYKTADGQFIRILSQKQELSPEGSYQWAYETENGISAQEQGQLKQVASQQEAIQAAGSFSYTSPEGVPVEITYVADENGFQPQGNVIPTAPPIPDAILRSLEYIKTRTPEQTRYQTPRF